MREPRALTALAGWRPAAPRGALGRLAAVVWAAPLSAAGLLAGLGTLRAPTIREGVVLFARADGVTGWVLRRRGFTAAALGHVVIARGEPTAQLLAHELVHVRQAERLGPFMAPVYLGLLAAYGYREHPFERAARSVEAAPPAPSDPSAAGPAGAPTPTAPPPPAAR